MSDLQIALFAAAVGVVALVWGYNKWQERKHRQLAEKVFSGGQPDVLLAGEEPDEVEPPPTGERREPVIELPEEAAEAALAPSPPPLGDWADAVADCTICLEFAQPVAATALEEMQAASTGSLGSRLAWYGWSAEDAAGGWQPVADGLSSYAAVCVRLQLADRRGAVSGQEISGYLDGISRVAEQFSARIDLPAVEPLLAHARSLDEFCASVDMQLAIHVVESGGSGIKGTKLRGLAEAMGLSLQGDGLFHAFDDEGRTLFTLGSMAAEGFNAESLKTLALQGVTLTLDVPRVAEGPAAFDRMLAVAQQLSQGIGGTLVDAQRRALSEEMIAAIRVRVEELQQKMAAHQIVAGSARALRLFS